MKPDPNGITWDDEQPQGVTWDDEKPQPTNTLGQEAARQGGMFLRQAINAAASPAVLIDRVQAKASQALTGKHIGGTLGEDLNARLTGLGIPEAERPIERFGQDVAKTAPAFALPASLPAQVFGNAAIAATEAPAGQEGKQALWGGVAGAGGHALARTLGGMVKPTRAAKELMDRGVALTPGQAAGTGSMVNRLEQWASSNPVASVPIRNAQRRGVQEANVAAAQSVANLVDDKLKLGLPPAEAVEQTRAAISKTYDSALADVTVPTDVLRRQLMGQLQNIAVENPMMTLKEFRHMEQYVKNRLDHIWQQGFESMDGQMLKQADSEIGQFIRNLQASTDAASKTAVPAWRELQNTLREIMALGAKDPAQVTQLNAANAAYRQLLALEKSRLAGADYFTPRQLARQVEKSNLGSTDLGKVSRAMTQTLPNTVPDSGTTERLIANLLPSALLGGGVGAQNAGYSTLGTGMMAAGALGSRPGIRFMTGGYGWQPSAEAIIRALRGVTPAAVAQDGEQ